MTECTSKRYWRARINEARTRYVEWARAPMVTVNVRSPDYKAYDRWVKLRVDHFNGLNSRWGKRHK